MILGCRVLRGYRIPATQGGFRFNQGRFQRSIHGANYYGMIDFAESAGFKVLQRLVLPISTAL